MANAPTDLTARDRKTRLFLSYSRKDLAFAENLHLALEKAGYDVLLDRTDIAAGEDWQARLGRLITEADTMVFCLSPNSITSRVCSWEVAEAERLGKRILPVILRKTPDADIPAALSKLNFIFMDGRNKAAGLAALKDALEQDLPWMREHTRLGDLALVWRKKPGNAGILRGPALEDAERWIASQPRNAALATDLHRDFITASRKAASTRQRNWIGGAAAVVLLSLGLAGWSEINRREAVRQTAIAEEQRQQAKQSLESASRAANGMVFDLAMEFSNSDGVPVRVVRKTLDQSQLMLEDLLKYNQSSADIRFLLATTYGGIADSFVKLGESGAALNAAEKAVTILAELASSDAANPKWKRHLSFALTSVSGILQLQGGRENALSRQKHALSLAREMTVAAGATDEDFSVYAQALTDTAILMAHLDQDQAAIELLQTALKTRLYWAGRIPASSRWQSDVAASYLSLGQLLAASGHHDDALLHADQALTHLVPLQARQPEERQYQQQAALAHELAAAALGHKEDFKGALERHQNALRLRLSLANRHPDNADLQKDASAAWSSVGRANVQAGDMLAAFDSFNNATDVLRVLVEREPENLDRKVSLAVAVMDLGDFMSGMGQTADALAKFDESYKLVGPAVARDGKNAQWRKVLALIHWRLADTGDAPSRNYQKALELLVALKDEGALRKSEWPLVGQLREIIAGLPG